MDQLNENTSGTPDKYLGHKMMVDNLMSQVIEKAVTPKENLRWLETYTRHRAEMLEANAVTEEDQAKLQLRIQRNKMIAEGLKDLLALLKAAGL